jgi:phosphatidate cytidylyltransferase
MHPVFLLTLTYFVIGAAATWFVNRRSAEAVRRARWTKIGVYFGIVHTVILAILSEGWRFAGLAAALVAFGVFELFRAVARSSLTLSQRIFGVALPFAAIGLAFVQFARSATPASSLFVYVVVLSFDGFSQITGQILGRHLLAPRISPGKTVEGLLGGLVMAAVTAIPLAGWTGIGGGKSAGLALLVAAFALLGDLAASAIKRACRVKDYGTLIPGHGGVLDRFDSFMAAGGAFWAVSRALRLV